MTKETRTAAFKALTEGISLHTTITRETARQVMAVVDNATRADFQAMGLEAFRFDADVCTEEGWLMLKIKVRPIGRT